MDCSQCREICKAECCSDKKNECSNENPQKCAKNIKKSEEKSKIMQREEIDITENVAHGDIDEIIDLLQKWKKQGYDRLYWDGYDSAIYVYKSFEKIWLELRER